jgi:hypothetical protein
MLKRLILKEKLSVEFFLISNSWVVTIDRLSKLHLNKWRRHVFWSKTIWPTGIWPKDILSTWCLIDWHWQPCHLIESRLADLLTSPVQWWVDEKPFGQKFLYHQTRNHVKKQFLTSAVSPIYFLDTFLTPFHWQIWGKCYKTIPRYITAVILTLLFLGLKFLGKLSQYWVLQ